MVLKYDIPGILSEIIGYRGLPFPAAIANTEGGYDAEEYDPSASMFERQQMINGTELYKQDFRGIWYFMPVYISHKGKRVELQNAVISITGEKIIVKTPLVGRKGSVKELISIDDYKINITAFIHSDDGTYPAEAISEVKELYNINEAVEIISVLTDLILDTDDKVVITNIDYPATPGIEDGQAVRIECETDKEFELTL